MNTTKKIVDNLSKLIRLPQDATPNGHQIISAITAAVLTRSTVILHGPPGCAKSTIIKLIAKAFGIEGKWRINGTSGTKEEDLVGGLDLAALAQGQRKVIFSPFLTTPIALLDEVDKISQFALAPMLPVLAENEARVGVDTLQLKKRFFAMTMNPPMAGQGNFELPDAFRDRADLEIFFPQAGPAELHGIFKGVMDASGDLVNAMPALGTSDDLTALQEEVSKIPVSEEAYWAASLYTAATSICKKDAKQEGHNFPACCADCELAESTFPCSKVTPLSPRAGLSALNVAKGIAYMRGATKVEKKDIDTIFPMVMSHRIAFPNQAVDNLRSFVFQFFGRLSGACTMPLKLILDPESLTVEEKKRIDSIKVSEIHDPLLQIAIRMSKERLAQAGGNLAKKLAGMTSDELRNAKTKGAMDFKTKQLVDRMLLARKVVSVGLEDADVLTDQSFRDLFTSPDGTPFLATASWEELASEGRISQMAFGSLDVDMFYEDGILNLAFSDGGQADPFRDRINSHLETFGGQLISPYIIDAALCKDLESAGILEPKGA